MTICPTIESLREEIKRWRNNQETVAFVPTMGNLHAGHLSLVELAQQKAQRVVVSIYVNPLQFSPDEDFASYPRTLEDDLNKLQAMDVDIVFTPTNEMIYPNGELHSSFVEVPALTHIVEGEFRPDFFRGVATVVLKLFNMVQPDISVFGEKDFQQLLIIKQIVKDFNLPIEIIGAEIKREVNGLAMSSRNNYLSESESHQSRFLSETLRQFRAQIESGINIIEAENEAGEALQKLGFVVDYITLRKAENLGKIINLSDCKGNEVVILAAAKLGKIRLIDNIKFTL